MKTILVAVLALCSLQVALSSKEVIVTRYESQVSIKSGYSVAGVAFNGFLELVKADINFKINLLNSLVLAIQNLVKTVIGVSIVPGQQELVKILSTIGTTVTGITASLLNNVTISITNVGSEIEEFTTTSLSDFGGVLGPFDKVIATAFDGAIDTVVECITDFQLALQAEVAGIIIIYFNCIANPIYRIGEALLAFYNAFNTILSILNPLKVALLRCRGGLLAIPCVLPALVTAVAAGALTLPAVILTAATELSVGFNLAIGVGVVGQCLAGIAVGKLTGLKAILEGATRCAATGAGAVIETGGSIFGFK